jgi:arginine decarboxylase
MIGYAAIMDQDTTPVLGAIEQYRRDDHYTFALPGHRLGRGLDDRTAAVLSRATLRG